LSNNPDIGVIGLIPTSRLSRYGRPEPNKRQLTADYVTAGTARGSG